MWTRGCLMGRGSGRYVTCREHTNISALPESEGKAVPLQLCALGVKDDVRRGVIRVLVLRHEDKRT